MSDTKNNTEENFEEIKLIFPKDEDARLSRLDQFLSNELSELSRARIKKLIESDMITVNGLVEKPSLKLKGGEEITVKIPPAEPVELIKEDLNLNVVFEDEHLIVVNKPWGMVTHPGAGVDSGTLVNALLYHCEDSLSGIGGVERPGIVHRLDKDTSGLLVVAKNDIAHRSLAKQIAEKSARRKYVAIVEGVMKVDSGVICKPIGRHPVKRKEMAVVENGRSATTEYRVEKRFSNKTLVRLELKTGRTHQIRVHLSHLGYPVVGDIIYNKKGSGTLKARKKLKLEGQCLHATSLSFLHPVTAKLLEFSADPPEPFTALLNRLK